MSSNHRRIGVVTTAALLISLLSIPAAFAVDVEDAPGLVLREDLFETAAFPQCHASTIVATPSGLVAAWFGGTREGNADVGIWVSRHDGRNWSAPVEAANGVQSAETRHPCWNPVLFALDTGENASLALYYKVGPSPSRWWGMKMISRDHGKSWSKPERLPDGILGPIKNKPVLLKDGTILSGSSTEHEGWRVHFERSADRGDHWTATSPANDGKTVGAIQPTILAFGAKLEMLCRTRQSRIYQSWSDDQGKSWSDLSPTTLPNNNSGLDAVSLRDGRGILVYNHTTRGRSPLNVSVSSDGQHWEAALVLENQPGEYSYPAVIQAPDGTVHATYTWNRKRIRHVVIDPAKLAPVKIVDGQWPTAKSAN